MFYAAYIVVGALVRLTALYETRPGVRSERCAGVGVHGSASMPPGAGLRSSWPDASGPLAAAIAVAALVCAGQLVQFGQWAAGRTYKNYLAMVELGRILPPGTLVHGKLANGLSLENRIKPVFVGRGFGNYDDRKRRDDVRYILTYVAPYVGYEGRVIRDVLDAYPDRTIIRTFDVAETTGHDQAALIDKFAETHGDRPDKLPERTSRRLPIRALGIEHTCAQLTNAPSRRTPTCGSGPSTTTRSSSTTGAPRSSHSSNAPAWP